MSLLHSLATRWELRRLQLACPQCKAAASSSTFKRGRYLRGEDKLVCEHCNEGSLVTFWRFEGLSNCSPVKVSPSLQPGSFPTGAIAD